MLKLKHRRLPMRRSVWTNRFHRSNNRRPRSLGDRGRRDEVVLLDSLSRPPVTETDVFAHGSMPSDELGLPDGLADDPLRRADERA